MAKRKQNNFGLIVTASVLIIILTIVYFSLVWPLSRPVHKPVTNSVSLANPASVNCEQKGGRVEIRNGSDGGQIGYCVFANKSECEEWTLLRGECKPVDSLTGKNVEAIAKGLFAKKYPTQKVQSIQAISVTTDHIMGAVKFAPPPGLEAGEGGIFFAAKVNGVWKLIFDGNGMISCSLLRQYNFPSSMANNCYE